MFRTRDIIARAADNLALHMSWVQARVTGMHVAISPRLVLADSGLDTDTFNTICRARLESTTAEEIRTAIAYFRTRRRPFSWWIGPGDTPADLPRRLNEAGLIEAESEIAMSSPLAQLSHAPLPPGLVIERVRSREQLADFARVTADTWIPSDSAVVTFYDRAADVLLGSDCPLLLYLGRVDRAPVAVAEVAIGDETAGLYNVSTRAAHRRRGIGMAMTLHALRDARALGASMGVLQASADGAGVYTRAGFTAFGEYREFKPPESM